MNDKIIQIQDFINKLIFIILQIVMFCMVFMVVGQVFSRYVLNSPNQIVEELLRFSLIWAVMLGSISCFIHDEHIALTLLLDSVSPKANKIIQFCIHFIVMGFVMVIMVYGGINLSVTTLGQLTPLLRLPMGVVYSIIPISGIIILFVKTLQVLALYLECKNQEKAAQ